jgi:hypothetical protein
MDEHIIPLKQTLKEQQKRIDEQKEMISKQAHLIDRLMSLVLMSNLSLLLHISTMMSSVLTG